MRGDNVMQNDRNDLISRQIAIEAIKEDKIDLTNPNVVAVFKATGDFEKVETQVMTCDRHIEILKDLPSAQPEIIWCKDCLMHGVCRFEQGLGLNGYCSQAERKANG